MKKTIFILFISVFAANMFAQEKNDSISMRFDKKTKNTFFMEVGGNTMLYSLNYDRIIFQKKNMFISTRVGLSCIPLNANFSYLFPFETDFCIGKKNNHFEVGAGILYFHNHSYYLSRGIQNDFVPIYLNMDAVILTGRIGYRYQRPTGGFFFRASFVPMVQLFEKTRDDRYGTYSENVIGGFSVLPWAGISFGYTLKNK
jgi:hypothetical protein